MLLFSSSGVSFYWEINSLQKLCWGIENGEIVNDKKLMTFVGNCCGYQQFDWMDDGSIKVSGKGLHVTSETDVPEKDKEARITNKNSELIL